MTEYIKDLINLAEQGNANAQDELGDIYLYGEYDEDNTVIIEKNIAEAVKWHLLAANQGIPNSQWAMGTHCFLGEYVEKIMKRLQDGLA